MGRSRRIRSSRRNGGGTISVDFFRGNLFGRVILVEKRGGVVVVVGIIIIILTIHLLWFVLKSEEPLARIRKDTNHPAGGITLHREHTGTILILTLLVTVGGSCGNSIVVVRGMTIGVERGIQSDRIRRSL